MADEMDDPDRHPPMEPETQFSFTGDALTVRAVACGIILGSAVCFANTYFGLQAGIVNAMPMQSALLGFGFFRTIQHRLSQSLSPKETTIIEVVAGALGLAPFTSGFTSFLPALQYLITPEEGGPVVFSAGKLILWSITTCGLGIVAAAPFRRLFILRERLLYPSATATGTLIGILFGDETIVSRANQRKKETRNFDSLEGETRDESLLGTDGNNSQIQPVSFSDSNSALASVDVGNALKVLLVSLAGSSLFSLFTSAVPILRRLPIFGLTAAEKWFWAFDLSPAYFGYGIIIGPSTNAYMFLGAVIGWGILSPVAKHRGWAPGSVGDWENGSRGWILWVGMALILGDSMVGLGWFIFKPFALRSWDALKQRLHQISTRADASVRRPLLGGDSPNLPPLQPTEDSGCASDHHWPESSRITSSLLISSVTFFLVLCICSLLIGFHKLVVPFPTLVAIILVLPASFISIRSLGETDNGASLAIGRISQLIIALLVPASRSKYMSANLLLGGFVESGASQAAQHMGGQKTAYMTETAPRAVFYGQIIGSFVGTLIATLAYRLYTSVQTFPSKEFDIPDAHMWLVAARFIHQQGLPPRALDFSIAAFVIGAGLSVLRIMGQRYWWRKFIPSGVAMAIGMYVVPAITLPRMLGSLIPIVCRKKFGIKYFVLLCCATGLILGQGFYTIVTLSLDSLYTPHE